MITVRQNRSSRSYNSSESTPFKRKDHEQGKRPSRDENQKNTPLPPLSPPIKVVHMRERVQRVCKAYPR